MTTPRKLNVLLEMRPALDGYAGIPQETRLLFRGLCMVKGVALEGLLQTSLRFLAKGMRSKRQTPDVANGSASESARLDAYSKLVLSVDNKPSSKWFVQLPLYFKRRRLAWALTLSVLFYKQQKIKTTFFEARFFETFIWQALFAKTLHADDFALVTSKDYRVCTVPWNIFQTAGLYALKLRAKPIYPALDTTGIDVFIAQTPYPARVSAGTQLVVRYHDALPIFMPHAFANKVRHQAIHANALLSNVQCGAYFACVSEATRQDLLRIYPELKDRAVTIHNMVSHYFYEEASPAASVLGIVRTRINMQTPAAHPEFSSLAERDAFYKTHLTEDGFKYLLMVSTIEPRKNHALLLAAWEQIRVQADPSLRLVIVGNLGWGVDPIMQEMRTWIDQGALFVLNHVPAADLRVLYRHAQATVCPSLAEGFDYSGVECMRSGGLVVASDIAVHREVFAHAAQYFATLDVTSLVDALKQVLYTSGFEANQHRLRDSGKAVSSRYLPENILPQWEAFLDFCYLTKVPTLNAGNTMV